MKPWIDRLRSRTAAFVHDLATVPVAWLGAYWLRFNLGAIPEPFLDRALTALPLVLLIQATIFWVFGLYRGIWRFASLPDLMRIAKGALAGTALTSLPYSSSTVCRGYRVPFLCCTWDYRCCCWPARACSTGS